MANKKKQSKVSKKKTKNTGISTEFSNLITIFIGVFLLYGLNSTSMGLIGSMTQEVFKGLFGSLAILIPILIILVGVLGFFDDNEYVFRLKKSKVYYIAIIFIFIFYGLLNSNLIPVDNPLRPEMISSIMKVAVENQGIGLITSIIVYFIKEIFGITGGWLISLFALFLSILFVFNISIQDLIFAIKNKSTNPKNSNANFKDMLKNLKESALDIITDEVDDTTMVEEKTGFFKKLMKDKDKKQNQQEFVPNEDNEDYNEYDDEKTVKIVGFNQADDDVLEILEGTQTVDYTQDDLKELNDLMRGKTNTQSTLEETNDYSDTLFNTNVNTKNNSDLEQLQFNLPSDKKQENISNGSSNYKKPSINCLKNYNGSKNSYKEQNKSKEVIDTLKNFNIEIQDCNATFGTTITIEAPVPGKSVIGIEVPNDKPQVVGLREVITSNEFINDPSSLAVGLGKEISGKPLIADLAKMPHLLIAGATGSGKSVCVNTIITSLLYKSSPEEVKLLLIDPKVVELAHYNGIPHLLSPVVTDPKKASNALNWAVNEMNKRYQLFAENGVKDIAGYNRKCENKMHKIVIIIDE